MLAKLEGKRTYILAFLVALYGLLKAFWPDTLPTIAEGTFEMILGLLFAFLRAKTSKPGVLAGNPS